MNLDFFKEHPYETGGIVIVCAVVLFYFLSSSGGSGASSGGSSSADFATAVQADAQLAQINAGAQVQNNAQQVALETAKLGAQVQNYETSAQLATALASITGNVSINDSNNFATVTD